MDPALLLRVGMYRYEGEFVMNRRARLMVSGRTDPFIPVSLLFCLLMIVGTGKKVTWSVDDGAGCSGTCRFVWLPLPCSRYFRRSSYPCYVLIDSLTGLLAGC